MRISVIIGLIFTLVITVTGTLYMGPFFAQHGSPEMAEINEILDELERAVLARERRAVAGCFNSMVRVTIIDRQGVREQKTSQFWDNNKVIEYLVSSDFSYRVFVLENRVVKVNKDEATVTLTQRSVKDGFPAMVVTNPVTFTFTGRGSEWRIAEMMITYR